MGHRLSTLVHVRDFIPEFAGILRAPARHDRVFGAIYCGLLVSKETKDAMVADFGDGAEIEVPLNRLVTELSPGNCVTDIAPNGQTMGDPFLRNVYFTFDYDELTVEFSAANYTDTTDVVKIT